MTGMAMSPSVKHYQQRDDEKLFENLKRFHVVVLCRPSHGLSSRYAMQRAQLLARQPLMAQRVQSMEQTHALTLGHPGVYQKLVQECPIKSHQ